MRCLYCGKERALLKRLTGDPEFCSEDHKRRYQEEYNRLAVSRLLQARSADPKPPSVSAGARSASKPVPQTPAAPPVAGIVVKRPTRVEPGAPTPPPIAAEIITPENPSVQLGSHQGFVAPTHPNGAGLVHSRPSLPVHNRASRALPASIAPIEFKPQEPWLDVPAGKLRIPGFANAAALPMSLAAIPASDIKLQISDRLAWTIATSFTDSLAPALVGDLDLPDEPDADIRASRSHEARPVAPALKTADSLSALDALSQIHREFANDPVAAPAVAAPVPRPASVRPAPAPKTTIRITQFAEPIAGAPANDVIIDQQLFAPPAAISAATAAASARATSPSTVLTLEPEPLGEPARKPMPRVEAKVSGTPVMRPIVEAGTSNRVQLLETAAQLTLERATASVASYGHPQLSPKPDVAKQPAAPPSKPTENVSDVPSFGATNAAATSISHRLPPPSRIAIFTAAFLALLATAFFLFRPQQATAHTEVAAVPKWTTVAKVLPVAGSQPKQPITLYRSSANWTDYVVKLQGRVGHQAIGWVFRVTGQNSYYAMSIETEKTGPTPTLALVKYRVIQGKESAHAKVPLPIHVAMNTLLDVRVDVHGPRFVTYIQNKCVDVWADAQLKEGGPGYFGEHGAPAPFPRFDVEQSKGSAD